MKIDFRAMQKLNIRKVKKNRTPLFVYFLIKRKTIVYIGSTVNIEERIRSHIRGEGRPKRYKKFDSVYYIFCRKARELESSLIKKIPTKHNNLKWEKSRMTSLTEKRIDFLINKYIPIRNFK